MIGEVPKDREDVTAATWKRSILLAVCAVYGPSVLVGAAAAFIVECRHCILLFWQFLPASPGLMLADFIMRATEAPRFGMLRHGLLIGYIVGVFITLSHVAAIAWAVRRNSWRNVILAVAALFYAALATLFMAMLRA